MKKMIIALAAALALIWQLSPTIDVHAATWGVRLVVDGKDISALSEPVIENNRTLVALRFISEEIGAKVSWNGETETVTVEKGDNHLKLIIGSRLIEYDKGKSYQISDVAPRIINDRTYVPLRLVSNALGTGIKWNEDERTVYVDSTTPSDPEPFYDLDIKVTNGTIIRGSRDIRVDIPEKYKDMDGQLRLLLLDSQTGSGFIRGRGRLSDSTFTFIPHVEDVGDMVLAALVCDDQGNIIEADAKSVTLDIKPEISLPGIEDYSIHHDSITLTPKINFLASYVEYEFKNMESGETIYTDTMDPYDTYTWTPGLYESGDYELKAIAYDHDGNVYESETLHINMDVKRILKLKGVSEGMTINKPVVLYASRNFLVDETLFIAVDRKTGVERILKTIPTGSYEWFPSADEGLEGGYDLKVRVKDSRASIHTGILSDHEDFLEKSLASISGSFDWVKKIDTKEDDTTCYESQPIHVTVDTSPRLIIKGIGPGQVITSPVDIYSVNNTGLESVQYYLKNQETGSLRMLGEIAPDSKLNYLPLEGDEGRASIFARGYIDGRAIDSDYVSLSIYTGKTYSSRPLMEKD